MKIAITVGHSRLENGNYTSANSIKNEYLTMKKLAPYIKKYLEQEGHKVDVIICPELKFNKSTEEKNYKLNIVNKNNYDLLIELHMNAFNTTAKGTEVLYISNKGYEFAKRIEYKLSTIFDGRGVKKRDDLYILRESKCPAILLEICFCDNKKDCDLYDKAGDDKIAKLIAEGILNKTISSKKETTNNPLYRVVVSSYKERANAERLLNELREKGYPAFIDVYEK